MKRFLSLLVVFVMVLGAVSCAKTPGGDVTEPPATDTPATDTVTDAPVTDAPATDPVTDTSNVTDPVTDLVTDPVTDPVTEPVTTPVTDKEPDDDTPKQELENYPANQVRHIFTHCLIAYPEQGCGYKGAPLDADCLTVPEFVAILEDLYERGYSLIDINDMYENYTDTDGTVKARLKKYVQVPVGRKPLVLSIDDVVYDSRKSDWGMIDHLIIHNGTIMCVGYVDGKEEINDLDVFPQLEKFIAEHPDFSTNGAKCTIALTGFQGILGYRTDEMFAEQGIDYMAEREKVKPVIAWLKENGYNFASHSYSHRDYGVCSQETVDQDIIDWNKNVKPLIGETQIFIYPFGAFTYYGSETHTKLLGEGFTVFCGTSSTNCLWDGMFPKLGGGLISKVGNIYLERYTITGTTLRMWAEKDHLKDYCDVYEVYDNEARYEKLVKPEQ